MRVAVANSDFQVALVDGATKTVKPYQVANGEDLKILSKCTPGVIKLEPHGVSEPVIFTGYLVEIEGQMVFIDEKLLEMS